MRGILKVDLLYRIATMQKLGVALQTIFIFQR